jgi:cytoskeletal protein CcmA (bactofilin family)
MTLEGDAVVLGRFEGEMRVGGLLQLDAGAMATGRVIAAAVRLAGSIDGDVIAEHGIEMTGGATLTGRLFATRLSIDQGASFEGDIHVGPTAMQAADDAMEQPRTAVRKDATAPLRLTHDQPSASKPSVIGNLLDRRRAKLMSAAQSFDQTVEQSSHLPAI